MGSEMCIRDSASFVSANSASTFGPDSQVSAIFSPAPSVGNSIISSYPVGPTSHGPYSGTPTTTGALSTIAAAVSLSTLPPNPTATYYNTNGLLTQEQPIPYQPAGGLGTNFTQPRYMVESDFDWASLTLGSVVSLSWGFT